MSEWRRYKDPSGEFYYFNTQTKRISREQPLDFIHEKRKNGSNEAIFAIPLRNNWYLIICRDGSKFYFDASRHLSNWSLEDEESIAVLNKVDRMLLSLLVGVARGFTLRDERDVYSEVLALVSEEGHDSGGYGYEAGEEDEQKSKDRIEMIESGAEASVSEPEVIAKKNEESDSKSLSSQGLVAGYSSSEEEDEEEEEEDKEELAIGIYEENPHQIESQFFEMLDEFELDPYSTWSIQSKKIINDSRYHLIFPDARRSELFEIWCGNRIHKDEEIPTTDTFVKSDYDELEPTKYHYLAHIISKSEISSDTLYSDIKQKYKKLFKKLNVNDTLTKKEQQTFGAKLLAYYKNMSFNERKEIFRSIVNKKLAFPELNEKLKELTISEMPCESFEIETQLLELENELQILQGDNASLQEDAIYYSLGIKEKLNALKFMVKEHYSI